MRQALARVAVLGLLFGVALALASCGQPDDRIPETGATLDGTIKYGTEDIQFALVIVVGESGPSATGKVGEDGRYKVENCPVGNVKVAVNTEAGRGDFMSASMSKSYKGPSAKGGRRVALKFLEVPKTYHDPSTTPLRTTVAKGPNTYDITIPK